jgi:hypothetical protein
MKLVRLILNALKITAAFLLLFFLFIIEGIAMIIYLIIEAPLKFTLNSLEKAIRSLLKYVR